MQLMNDDNFGYQKDCVDPLAGFVNTCLRHAAEWRRSEMYGGASTEEHLARAQRQMDLENEPCDMEAIEESGVDMYIPLTEMQGRTFTDHAKATVKDIKRLITARPSSIVELNETQKYEVVQELREWLSTQDYLTEKEIRAQAEFIVTKFKQLREQKAELSSEHNIEVIYDYLEETKFAKEMVKFINWFVLFPYAVMLSPVKEHRVTLSWRKDKLVETEEFIDTHKAYDPRDYFYAKDVTEAGSGSYEILLDSMSRDDFYRIVDGGDKYAKDGWNLCNVQACVDNFTFKEHHHWLSSTTSARDKATVPWGEADSLSIIRFYGKVRGEHLSGYEPDLDAKRTYETSVIVCAGHVLYVDVHKKPKYIKRPIHVSSYTKRNNSVAGKGIAYHLYDIQRAVNSVFRRTIRNMAFAAEPFGEVELDRIKKYLPEGSLGDIGPGEVKIVDQAYGNTNRPAYQFHQFPDRSVTFLQMFERFFSLAERLTGIPATLNGTPVGSGALRTWRGMMQLQANAMTGIESVLGNLDTDIVTPIGEGALIKHKLTGELAGDADTVIHGFGGVLRDMMDEQEVVQNLQSVLQLAAAAPDSMSPAVIQWAIHELLKTAKVPTHVLGNMDNVLGSVEPTIE